MGLEKKEVSFVFSTENDKTIEYDVSTLINIHSQGSFDNKIEFSNSKLAFLYEHYATDHPDDERVYDVFSSYFIKRGMLNISRSALYCRLYLLERDSEEYKSTCKTLNLVEEKIVSDLISLPKSMVSKLFLRDHNYNLKTWRSKMYYTHVLAPHTYGTLNRANSFVSISNTKLEPGVLLFKTTPVAVAPWQIKPNPQSDSNLSKNEVYCCFHCLSTINKPFNFDQEDSSMVACPKHPRECIYFFCSKECFLKNGAVHSMECEHLVKLKKFSEYYLNQSITLLVSRVLIRCRLSMDSTSRICELDSEPDVKSDLLDSLLNYYVDYSFLNLHHPQVLEEVNRFASFLLDSLGFDFCLHLTHRELAHITIVVWLTSMPFTSYLNHLSDTDDVIGGSIFTFEILHFKPSHIPNCVAHFDDGKLTFRTIYHIDPGTELTINTFIDKYVPPFIQAKKFWSVSSVLSSELNENMFMHCYRALSSIRCKKCINSFCYSNGYADSNDLDKTPEDKGDRYINYKWQCSQCSSVDSSELDLLQNKAEDLFLRAQKLYFDGEFVQSKNCLLDFVNKWSGVLHPGHYLMYNSYLLLSGMLMNKPGGNVHDAIFYLRKALIQADQVLPLASHHRAYLYDRFADYLLKMKSCTRVKGQEYNDLKHLIMDALYSCLWNWTLISGTDSYQSKCAIQKCRSVAFSLNIHTFPLSKRFIINVPNKYSVFFKRATGTRVVPNAFTSNLVNVRLGNDKPHLSDLYSLDDASSMAFCAAQSGDYDETVLDILTTIQSYGIHHLGTGLSILGIIASNYNLEFFNAMLKSLYNRILHHLDSMALSTKRNSELSQAELYVINLIYSIFGPNDMGIDPLIALISTPYPVNKDSATELQFYVTSERGILNLLLTYAKKLNELSSYKYKLNGNVVSDGFYSFISSEFDFQSLMVNRTTIPMLGLYTPLHYASLRGKLELVEILIKHGALVNGLNHEGASPLHLASLNGHLEVVKALLKHNANPYLALKTGETPLHLAIYGLTVDVVEFLIELYKDSNLQSMKAPSIWHALACGIFRKESQKLQIKSSKSALPFEEVAERLTRAVEISKIFIKKMKTEKWLNCYMWANHLPSQLLEQLWNHTIENSSLFHFPKRPPTVYVVSNPNGLMETPLKILSNMESNNKTSLYGSLKESKYNVNNYSDLNYKNDVVFSGTRTFHLLLEIMKNMEEECTN